jgi:hypothetical protein
VDVEPEPDTKDWTWVLERECPECGFDARTPQRADLADLMAQVGSRWVAAMNAIADARTRPAPAVWSPLEYACHVRDEFDLARVRVGLMLGEDGVRFANWDQDATAIEEGYAGQDPMVVTDELARAAAELVAVLEAVPADAWNRTGLRSDGSTFTVESFTRYLLHDPVHHLTDVTGDRWA